MGGETIAEALQFLHSRHEQGSLRWNKEVADRFSTLLGSGYIKHSIRSLWCGYPGERRVWVGSLLEMAELWRTYLQKERAPDPAINQEFLRLMQLFLENLEGPVSLPTSPRFTFQGGRVQWLANPVNDDTGSCEPQFRESA